MKPDEESATEERSPAGVAQKPTHVAALEAELADRDRRLREALERERHAQLEVDNARHRLERDARKEVDRMRRELIVALLPVLDDLDRAIAAAHDRSATDPLVTGVELVRNGFVDRLRGFGVERFDPMGEPFDPSRHEAVYTVETHEPDRDGLVVTTVRPGYVAGVDTIRPAQVIVGRSEPRSRS